MGSNLNSMIKFNVAYIKLLTKIEGPFNRCCIWFQGCNINCKGCGNPDLQALKPNHIVTEDELLNIVLIAKDKYKIEGITLTGGEPSLQVGLKHFNSRIHELGLGIIMFSGKTKDSLDEELVNSVDLLIDGPFLENQIDRDRILLGSKNKKLHFITDRYTKEEDYFNLSISREEVVAEDYIFINGD